MAPAALDKAVSNKDALGVFVSYARRDAAFAARLVEALERRGLRARIDTRDLPTLEEWRRELTGLIAAADAVVFIISPASVTSDVCGWEVTQVEAWASDWRRGGRTRRRRPHSARGRKDQLSVLRRRR